MRNIILFVLGILLSAGVRAQSVQPSFEGIKTVNGVDMYIKVMGKGKPLLIIHGGPGMSHDYFLPYLEPLARKYKLILYDQRASGRSGIPEDSMGANYTNMIADIEALRKTLGIAKWNILAHSWGNILAINYAEKHPLQVQSLIMSNSLSLSHDFDDMQQDNINKRWKRDTMVTFRAKEIKGRQLTSTEIRMKLAFMPSFYNVDVVDSINMPILPNFADAQNAVFMGTMSEVEQYDRDYYPELKKITAPTLVIHGMADNIPLAASQKIKTSLPKGQLVTFDLSGHFPFIEEKDKYVQTVMNFLDSVNK